jgi:hypothetical protein
VRFPDVTKRIDTDRAHHDPGDEIGLGGETHYV